MPRKQHIYHYIYKTTCNVNGKYYVGMHSTSNLEDGYIGSGKRLWNSIRKHGRENHEIKILEWFSDRSSLKERERELVNESLLQDPLCMNLKVGGEGGFVDEDHCIKCSSAGGLANSLKLKNDTEHRENFSKKISETMLSKIEAGVIQSNYPSWVGRKHCEETKKKIGKTNSIKQKGEKNSQFGKCWIHNYETKENRKINVNDIVPDGWTIGRKMKKL